MNMTKMRTLGALALCAATIAACGAITDARIDEIAQWLPEKPAATGARIGEICEVLVDGCEDGRWYGRSILEAPESDGCIWLEGAEGLAPGLYVRARIDSADAYDLYATVIGEDEV